MLPFCRLLTDWPVLLFLTHSRLRSESALQFPKLTFDQFHLGLSEPYSVPVNLAVAGGPHLGDPSQAFRVNLVDLKHATNHPCYLSMVLGN
jgi:hypothetical protein